MINIPDGLYPSIWGYHTITFDVQGESVTFQTPTIRANDVPVLVRMEGGECRFEKVLSDVEYADLKSSKELKK